MLLHLKKMASKGRLERGNKGNYVRTPGNAQETKHKSVEIKANK